MSGTDSRIQERTREVMKLIKQRPEYLNDKDAIGILAKSVVLGNKILKASESCDHITMLCDYCQFLIDFSYAIEVKLVNRDFLQSDMEHFYQLAEYLDEAERVFEGVSARPSRVKELLECVCWRRGALFYMYCHTAFNDKERLIASEQQLQQFLEFALKGVQQLHIDMRKVRADDVASDYSSSDSQALELIKQGIFSDVHMLSLIYAAEMCYWICMLKGKAFSADGLIPREAGQQLSKLYIEIATGPLQSSHWSTETALTISNYFTTIDI